MTRNERCLYFLICILASGYYKNGVSGTFLLNAKFLDQYLANYQPLNYTPLSQEQLRDSTVHFNVTVHDSQFNLTLYKQNLTSSRLFGVDPKMFNSKTPVDYYYGEVTNDIVPSYSEVVGTFANGIFYGTVALCNTTTYKFVTVDRDMPPKRKTVALKQFHSVAYRQFKDLNPDRPNFQDCDCSHRDCYCHPPMFIECQIRYLKCLPEGVSEEDTWY
ncbi:hypothetical protein Ddc_13009 [Ditylenchus destructor]|nr:hypothetical protein Ddc_13009 [Ditylenchus destructor]